ncbi:hypothetical protein GCT13_08390 [Paraburkholderia sp. CNPSo 3157]|uniref:Uncharacterized protein n=1 Tax=Paraburkholderia franconis TaxID=2654983 RepID=A0A7X1TFA2_9BURK|nr:hypothetical protein [Paraburkholderia franconis]MPW16949.1 hypothetical protein [Paraburkholderia franconis]
MKLCPTCRTEKTVDAFYADKRKRDGLKSQCKTCHIAGNIRARDPEKKRNTNAAHMARARAMEPEKFAERDRIASRNRVRDERVLARVALNNAVKRGDITKPDCCETCSSKDSLHAHHDDYSKPLTVRWLCHACHGKEHRKERMEA